MRSRRFLSYIQLWYFLCHDTSKTKRGIILQLVCAIYLSFDGTMCLHTSVEINRLMNARAQMGSTTMEFGARPNWEFQRSWLRLKSFLNHFFFRNIYRSGFIQLCVVGRFYISCGQEGWFESFKSLALLNWKIESIKYLFIIKKKLIRIMHCFESAKWINISLK